jgi:hypothetical protein
MNIEINGSYYNSLDNFYNPDWWDKWSKKNLKKKVMLLSKMAK